MIAKVNAHVPIQGKKTAHQYNYHHKGDSFQCVSCPSILFEFKVKLDWIDIGNKGLN